jgi:hypothetical protein
MTAERRTSLLWLAVALLVCGGALLAQKLQQRVAAPKYLDWQRPVSEFTDAQRAMYTELRASLRIAEAQRSSTKTWPALNLTSNATWSLQQQRLAINYIAEAEGLRWLVLFLEPDPRVKEPAPPEDDEHHTLNDGTALHVTVWTQPLSASPSANVTAFPAAEGWVERVAR